jgi:guanylate kinase
MKVLGNTKKGLVFVVSAPAGTGKTTLVKMLKEEFACVTGSVSYTTRAVRSGELDGKDYHFISEAEFEAKIHAGEFLEYARVFDHFYGTSRNQVEALQEKGKHVVLVIDTQGALQLMGRFKASYIFISPPSLSELKKRLYGRKSEADHVIEQRLSWAEKEISLAHNYDYRIINDHLKVAYDVLRSILIAEEHKA